MMRFQNGTGDAGSADAAGDMAGQAGSDASTTIASPGEAVDLVQGWIETGQTWVVDEGPGLVVRLLIALAVFVVGRWIAKAMTGVLRKTLKARGVDATLIGFLSNITYTALITLVVIAVLGRLGIDTASFAAIIAAAGLAVGFALQGSLGNFASGVMIILFRPFKAGDFVEAGGTTGVVIEVGVFATTFKTGDNKKVIVPNGSITGGNITNYSANDTRRVDFVFGIGYGDDIKQAKELLEKIAGADSRILKDPATVIAVGELADSSVNILCRPWVKTADYWAVYWDMTEKVKLEFDAAGISIPYPQRDVHLIQEGAA